MPTYEYACRSCGSHLEVVQAFTDDALTECPACSGQLRKVFGSIGIAFKGSGFYKTDSRPSSGSSSKTDAAGDSKDSKEPKKEAASTSSSDSTSTKTDSPAKTDAPKKKEPAASGSGSGSGSAATSA